MDEIPEGLEDLLNSIRGEGKPQQSSALAVIPKEARRETDLVDDEIDERILALLGLENVTDIDYATYKTLLREKMMEGRMAGTGMSTEETELLTNEFKRVKSATGRFKIKRKKINVGSFFETAQEKAETTTAEVEPAGALVKDPMRDLQGPEIVEDLEEQQEKDDKSDQFIRNVLAPSLNKIEDNLQAILDTVTNQFKFDKKQSEKAADTAQNVRKQEREEKRETKVKGGVKDVASKVVKPVKGLFDMIIDFFKNILLGGALLWILNFLKDPAKAIQPLINAINGIISFINNIISSIFNFIFGPINRIIMDIYNGLDAIETALNDAIAKLPFGLANNIPGYPFNNIDPSQAPIITMPNWMQIPPVQNPFGQPGGGQQQSQQQQPVQQQAEGGVVLNVGDISYTEGGPIKPNSGVNITGLGQDTQLIAAQPGEIMMSRPAVEMFGADNLLAMNTMAGSTNKPKMGVPKFSRTGMPPIMGAFNGGQVPIAGAFNQGGMVFDPNDPLGSFQRINQQLKQPLPGVQPSVMFPGASPLLQSPATQMFQPSTSANPSTPVVPSAPKATINQISGADYDVILPLDHTKKPGTVPDTPGGNTFKNSNATGAAGREREHQDKAAAIIGQKLTDMGLRVKIMTPEEYPSYQDYDKALTQFAAKGIRVVPLHFDAVRGAGGVGFLTRTRAGDVDDYNMSRPIYQYLKEFQAANPDLGNISRDTMGNATINRAALSPAALVELGVMVDWEKKYGKDFTSSSKFNELAEGVSKAIFEGGGFGTPPIPGTVTTTPLQTPQDPSSTQQSSPSAVTVPSLQPPAMRVPRTTQQMVPPGPPVPGKTSVIMAPSVGGSRPSNAGQTSAAMASQKKLPGISPIDPGNNELIVIKSIYNIVG